MKSGTKFCRNSGILHVKKTRAIKGTLLCYNCTKEEKNAK